MTKQELRKRPERRRGRPANERRTVRQESPFLKVGEAGGIEHSLDQKRGYPICALDRLRAPLGRSEPGIDRRRVAVHVERIDTVGEVLGCSVREKELALPVVEPAVELRHGFRKKRLADRERFEYIGSMKVVYPVAVLSFGVRP